jgi:acetyl esterase/lipase
MTETQYWQKLRKLIVGRVAYLWKINASYEAGVPDWYVSDVVDMWVENKRVKNDTKLPPLSLDLTSTRDYLTANQQLWLERRYYEGRRVGVVVFGKVGHLWLPGLDYQIPITREQYLEKAMTMPELADELVAYVGK